MKENKPNNFEQLNYIIHAYIHKLHQILNFVAYTNYRKLYYFLE